MRGGPLIRIPIIQELFVKEIRETLRDRRTLFMMFVFPIVAIPLLSIGLSFSKMSQDRRVKQGSVKVLVVGALPQTLRSALTGSGVDEMHSIGSLLSGRWEEEGRRQLAEGRVDAVLVVPRDASRQWAQHGSPEIAILFDSVKKPSAEARNRLQKGVEVYRQEVVRAREVNLRLPSGFSQGLSLTLSDMASIQKKVGNALGPILPLIIVMLSLTGSLYTAIEFTAGEKERGTMETLLCAPISSHEVIVGKFLAVWMVSLVSLLANLGSFGLSIVGVGQLVSVTLWHVPFSTMILVFFLLLPITVVGVALFMAVAVTARDFKDGSNLMTLVLMGILVPVMAPLGGLELNAWTAMIPLASSALVAKAAMTGSVAKDFIFLSLLSSTACAGLALMLAARIFQETEILLGGQVSWKSVFRPSRTREGLPTPSMSLSLFALVLILGFYSSLWMASRPSLGSLFIVQAIGVWLPTLLLVRWSQLEPGRALAFSLPSSRVILPTVMIALTLWVGVTDLTMKWFPPPEDFVKQMEKVFLLRESSTPIWMYVLVLAVVPAIGEELAFRGVIMRGFMRYGAWPAIIISAVFFGVAHGSMYRFLPTFLMGLALGWVVWRTRSLVAGMIIHGCHNALALVVAKSSGLGEALFSGEAFSRPFVLSATCVTLLGVGWLWWVTRESLGNSEGSSPSGERGVISKTS